VDLSLNHQCCLHELLVASGVAEFASNLRGVKKKRRGTQIAVEKYALLEKETLGACEHDVSVWKQGLQCHDLCFADKSLMMAKVYT
jgi:hypothetical protein